MAKHYSGKRVAGRKPVGKRALSLLMALVMSLSLVQITAFAVEEITNYRVVEQGTEVSDNAGLVTIKKTATHKTDDQFDINLSVTVKKTEETTVTNNPAHIVLVMDRSNSMEENSGRFANARKAAKTFVSALLKGNDTENDHGNRIAVVGFGTKADTGTAFSNDVEKLNGWIESATKAYKNNNDGGTNIQAGIHEAQRLLKNDGFAGKKIIVVFSDGMPTYSYRYVNTAEVTKCSGNLIHEVKEYKLTGTWHFDYNDIVGSGSSYGYRDNLVYNDYPYVICTCENHLWEKTDYITVKDIYKTNGDATIAEAKIAKDNGTEIYSVYLGGSDEQQNKNALETMKGIVSDAEKNFLSTNKMEDLAKLFGQIAQTITTETSGLTVSDPMGDFITLGDVKALVDAGVITLAEDRRSFTWNVSQSEATINQDGSKTYTLIYPVTLNAAAPEFESGTAYPTNGTTTLTYYVTGDRNAHTLDFVVPTVTATKATTPPPATKYTLTVHYYIQGTTDKLQEDLVRTIDANTGYAVDVPLSIGEYSYRENTGDLLTGLMDGDKEVNLYYAKDEVEPVEYTLTVHYYIQGTTDKLQEDLVRTIDANTGYAVDVPLSIGEYSYRENTGDLLTGLMDGDKEVNLYYKLAEVEPEGPFTYWVQHIYMNGATIDGKTYDEVTEVPYGTEVDPMAIEPVLKYTTEDGVEHVYEVESRDPMEKTLITENAKVFTIFYQRNDPTPEYITVTVNYVEKDNISNVLHNSQSEQFELVGGVVAYDVTGLKFNSLTKGGTTYSYDSADAALTGKVESDLTITLYYKAESNTPVNPPVGPTVTYYSVTVNYYDKASGEVIHEKYSTTQREYTTYDVTAQDKIAIEGYTYVETSGDALTGTLNGNKVINVYYSKTTDIDDGDTPTTPAEPGSDIGDDDVPTTPAQPPKTGDSMGLWIAAALVSGMGLVWLALSGKKREERA